jgi:DNA-directed RNA polymerase subunit RPC12/RpoP
MPQPDISSEDCDHVFETRPIQDLWICRDCGFEVLGVPRNPRGGHQDKRREREANCDHDRLETDKMATHVMYYCLDCGGEWKEEPPQ